MTQGIGLSGMPYPTSYSLLATPMLLADVMTDYDVGNPLQCQLWLSGVTDTYVVTTDRDRYVLRVYRTGWRTDDDVAYELDALKHLQDKGVPVAAPIIRKDGTWFRVVQAPEGQRQIVLFTYARGREAYTNETFSFQFGRSVATIHNATDTFRSPHPRFHIDLSELLDKPLAAIQPLLAHRPNDWIYLRSLAERLWERITNFPASTLDWGFCHGDCHGANTHLDSDTVIIFDFDCCGPGWRAYDLATFQWIWQWHDAKAAPKHWELFLRGYQEQRAIGEHDMTAVPLFVAVREFWLLGLHAQTAPQRGYCWVSDPFLDQRLKFFREWEQHHHHLRDLP